MIKKVRQFFDVHRKLLNIVLAIITIGVWFYVFKSFTFTYIAGEFEDLRPIHKRLPVYYKGLKVGHAYRMHHSKSYTSSLVHFVLYPSDLHLPANTELKLKKEKKKRHEYDFFELIYPEKPVSVLLANGDVLTGKTTVDVETFLANQDPDSLEKIKKDLADSAESLNNTITQLGQVFLIIQEMLESNQDNIKTASTNLAKTTGNINQISSNFSSALNRNRLNSAVSNLDAASYNVRTSTENLSAITQSIDGTAKSFSNTVPKIDSTIAQAQCIVSNVNDITCGIKQTMKKRFGGMRLLFGRTIEKNECTRRCCP